MGIIKPEHGKTTDQKPMQCFKSNQTLQNKRINNKHVKYCVKNKTYAKQIMTITLNKVSDIRKQAPLMNLKQCETALCQPHI